MSFLTNIIKFSIRKPEVRLMKGEKITVVLPATAKSEEQKADYILQAVEIMEKNIHIINKKQSK